MSVELRARASRGGGSGSNPTIEVAYATDGVNYVPVISETLTSTTVDELTPANITGSLTWQDIMSSGFRLRARRTAGTRSINLDSMYLRVTYGIDTLKEPWSTGGYAAFPITLSGGTIEAIAITDEESKVHLNYASQALLSNLLDNLGIASADTKADNIVSYRGAALTNPFDTVEELQRVTGITAQDYNTIKNYVTAYSFTNTNVYRPTGPRAPININTAPFEVLKAVFDPINLSGNDPASIANSIIAFRNSTPFTCFYSSNPAVTTDFYDFIDSLGYLTSAQQNRVIDNCDPSYLVPVSGYAGQNCLTTEFCYASNVFYIDVLVRYNNRDFHVKTLRGNDGSKEFKTYTADPTLSGWRKENFE